MAGDDHVPPLRRAWLFAVAAVALLFLIAPIFVVVPISFSDSQYLRFPPEAWSLRWYRNFLGSIEWRDSAWVSLRAALLTVLVATPLGTAAAYALHLSGGRWARRLRLALVAPLIVPVIIVAIGIFYLYARLGLVNSMTGLVLAHSVLAVPFVMITVGAGLQRYDMSQELAARSLGATRLQAFLLVTLPQLRGAILAGGLFAFITSLDEVVIALFIAGGDNTTLTRMMFAALRDQIDPTIAAISTLLIVLTSLLLLAAHLLARPRRR